MRWLVVEVGDGRADGDRHEDEQPREPDHRPASRHPRAADGSSSSWCPIDGSRPVLVIPDLEDDPSLLARPASHCGQFHLPRKVYDLLSALLLALRNDTQPRSIHARHVRFDGIVAVTLGRFVHPLSTIDRYRLILPPPLPRAL